jgi:hypothetical protein
MPFCAHWCTNSNSFQWIMLECMRTCYHKMRGTTRFQTLSSKPTAIVRASVVITATDIAK